MTVHADRARDELPRDVVGQRVVTGPHRRREAEVGGIRSGVLPIFGYNVIDDAVTQIPIVVLDFHCRPG
jgi:hypothetical protein